jgi:ABC-type spermidine/putrescine transport system permease subunit I
LHTQKRKQLSSRALPGSGDPAGALIGPRLVVAVPAAFLLLFFVVPNAFLLTISFLKSEDQVLSNQPTLENFTYLLTKPLYLTAILRSFWISAATGALVVLLSYPLAYYLPVRPAGGEDC